MMELKNSIGFISRMNPLIISMGKISFLDPIIQYSTIPPFQLHVVELMGHPSVVKPMPGHSPQSGIFDGPGFFIISRKANIFPT